MIKHIFATKIEQLLRKHINDKAFFQSADFIESNPFLYIALLLGHCSANNELVANNCKDYIEELYQKYSEEYFDKNTNQFEHADDLINELRTMIED